MPTCPGCRAAYELGDRYCPKCGQRLSPGGLEAPMGLGTEEVLSISGIQYRLGVAYFKKGDYLQAAEAWEKVLQGRPEDAELTAMIQDARDRNQAGEGSGS